MEITIEEVFFSTFILAIMVGFGVWISNPIVGALTKNALEVASAVRVDDAEKFGYIKRTNAGMFLAEGELIANDTIHLVDFPGIYSRVVKVKEEYCMHTETYTETDAKGNVTHHIRTYYSWDEKRRDNFECRSFTFLGFRFTAKEIGYSVSTVNTKTVYDKKHRGNNVRYIYYTTPVTVNGLMTGKADNNAFTDLKFKRDRTIKQAVENAERNRDMGPVAFWILWMMLTAGIICGFYALDNDWLSKCTKHKSNKR